MLRCILDSILSPLTDGVCCLSATCCSSRAIAQLKARAAADLKTDLRSRRESATTSCSADKLKSTYNHRTMVRCTSRCMGREVTSMVCVADCRQFDITASGARWVRFEIDRNDIFLKFYTH